MVLGTCNEDTEDTEALRKRWGSFALVTHCSGNCADALFMKSEEITVEIRDSDGFQTEVIDGGTQLFRTGRYSFRESLHKIRQTIAARIIFLGNRKGTRITIFLGNKKRQLQQGIHLP